MTKPAPFSGKIGILGAGALGCFYGAKLFAGGGDVHFLLRSDYDAVRKAGLQVKSVDGDLHLRPPVYRSAEDLGICDLILIGLKATQNSALPTLLAPTVGPQTLVLTLQNGLGNEEEIAAVLDRLGHRDAAARVLGGVAFLCSNRIAPGIIDHSAHGWVRLAEFRGPAQQRTHAIGALFQQAGIRSEVHDSLAFIRWAKLVWNIPFNGLGVAAERCDSQAVLQDDALAATALGLMEETIAAARADGVTIDPAFMDQMMHATTSMGPYRSSMQIDFEEGRPLEVEAILGEPYRRARRAGISVPRLEFLYGVVRRRHQLRGEN